jgi:hypothetical protein
VELGGHTCAYAPACRSGSRTVYYSAAAHGTPIPAPHPHTPTHTRQKMKMGSAVLRREPTAALENRPRWRAHG